LQALDLELMNMARRACLPATTAYSDSADGSGTDAIGGAGSTGSTAATPFRLRKSGHNLVLRQVLQLDHSPVLGLDHKHEGQ